MIPFGLLSPVTGEALHHDTPHSLREGKRGPRWPVVDGIPYLRVGRDGLVGEVLGHLDKGAPGHALELLLADQDDWWTGPPADPATLRDLVREMKYVSLREACARLGWGRVGDYFVHRWSDPTYLAGLALLEAHWNKPACAFELACGIGHYLRELQGRGVRVSGGDVVFAKLWVARHWVAGQRPQLVCFDAAGPHWPIDQAPVDLVMCHDAFYFLPEKARILDSLRKTAGEEGWLALSHVHNSARPGLSAGHAVSSAEIEELFPDGLVYDDDELTRALVEARAPVPAAPAALDHVEAFSVVCGPGMRPAPRPLVDGLTLPREGAHLRLNPLYRPDPTGGYVIAWPSERYRDEYAARATYPRHSEGPETLEAGPETVDRARIREFVDLPERW
ncbi:class I SAM-dependent methyltransferase [Methylobacterium currus]|uniref:Class I SAM-dependent methyltransferase n=1 Tax=Methylobacterium currus TaxID=2051553 RepID=A0A2R4WQD8_9HYPH|nr:class I SAM-dependent methyltransferase [Methylobacterium currus]AWB23715.1 class I SAM-dependent methyltransferase [Methylobacterium currus]UHC16612.1 class I SAM-dependent methyltransferase [Methylobacterium currus]